MRETIKAELKQRWVQLAADGNMTEEELRQSLQDQVDGYLDLAMDEITEEDAKRMNWEYGEMSDEQMDEWTEMVNEAAKEYLSKQEDKVMMNEMVTKMMGMVDLTDVGTWMVDAIPSTLTGMMEQTIGVEPDDFDEEYDTKCEEFFNAFWVAMAQANSEIARRDAKLLGCLKAHTIANARELAHCMWKDGEVEDADRLRELADKCENGTATDEEWDELMESTAE